MRYAPPTTRGRRLRTTVKDLLDNRLLEANTVLRPARKGVSGRAVVAASGELLVNGMPYKTPSGAAKAASGRQAESGWDFWLVVDQGTTSLADLRFRQLALERSRGAIKDKFEASIGNGLEGYYSVEADVSASSGASAAMTLARNMSKPPLPKSGRSSGTHSIESASGNGRRRMRTERLPTAPIGT